MPKHRQEEFRKFLKRIEIETEQGKDIHLTVDNHGSHKTKKIKKWLAKNPHFHLHFTPTSASWSNTMVERLSSDITTKKIRRGAFKSVKTLGADIIGLCKEAQRKPKGLYVDEGCRYDSG
jgi:transposase